MGRERKREKGAPTFVVEFPIAFSPSQRKKAAARFNCATAMYNACLRGALDRLAVARSDPRWDKARDMPRLVGRKPNAAKSALFTEAKESAGWTSSALMSFASGLRVGWVGEGVPSQEAQVIGRTAFEATARWCYQFHCAKQGRPRFKPMARGVRSMSSKDGNGAIRVFGLEGPDGGLGMQWLAGFAAPLTVRDNPVHRHGVEAVLNGRWLYCRVARRKVSSRWYYYLQIVCDGEPLQRHVAPDAHVGLDVGPSTVAVASRGHVALERFCDGLQATENERRRLLRKLDRQHRAGSPGCFDACGRHAPGRCEWSRSNAARATVARLVETYRRETEHRKSLHGNLANRVLGQGRHVHVEDLSKKSWQQNWGRSVGFRAPATFETLLLRKAVSAGGTATLVNPYRAKLSQLCVCGTTTKKPLSLRSHACPCGVREQRDVWSAFLARHTNAGGAVDLAAARTELGWRNDVGAGRGSVAPNLQVPKALLRVPEYASGRAGRLAQGNNRADTATAGRPRRGPKNHGPSGP